MKSLVTICELIQVLRCIKKNWKSMRRRTIRKENPLKYLEPCVLTLVILGTAFDPPQNIHLSRIECKIHRPRILKILLNS